MSDIWCFILDRSILHASFMLNPIILEIIFHLQNSVYGMFIIMRITQMNFANSLKLIKKLFFNKMNTGKSLKRNRQQKWEVLELLNEFQMTQTSKSKLQFCRDWTSISADRHCIGWRWIVTKFCNNQVEIDREWEVRLKAILKFYFHS